MLNYHVFIKIFDVLGKEIVTLLNYRFTRQTIAAALKKLGYYKYRRGNTRLWLPKAKKEEKPPEEQKNDDPAKEVTTFANLLPDSNKEKTTHVYKESSDNIE